MNRYEKYVAQIIKPVLFLLLGVVMLCGVQEVFTPVWNEGLMVGRTINGIDHLDVTNLDVLFLGTSHVQIGVSPLELYKKYAAHSSGLGSMWINALMTICDEPEVRSMLQKFGIPDTHIVWASIAMGWPAQSGKMPAKKQDVIKYL